MITEFQDGFITKTKLNELVGGINANSEDLSNLIIETNANSEDISGLSSDLSNLIIEINAKVLTADVTKTVGVGGDFTTLTEALNWCRTIINNGFKVTLSLASGYLLEQLTFSNDNLGFVTVYFDDSSGILVDGSGITVDGSVTDYVIKGINSICPNINMNIIGNGVCSGISLVESKMTYSPFLSTSTSYYTFTNMNDIINIKNSEISINGNIINGYSFYGSVIGYTPTITSNRSKINIRGRVGLHKLNAYSSEIRTDTDIESPASGTIYGFIASSINPSININNGTIAYIRSYSSISLNIAVNTITKNGIIFK